MGAVGHSCTAARAEHQLHPTHHFCLRGLLHPSSHSLPAIAIDPPPSSLFVFPSSAFSRPSPSPSRSSFPLTDLITAFCAVKHPSKPPSPARPPRAGVCFTVAELAASCTSRSRPIQNSVVLVRCRASPSRVLWFVVRIAVSSCGSVFALFASPAALPHTLFLPSSPSTPLPQGLIVAAVSSFCQVPLLEAVLLQQD